MALISYAPRFTHLSYLEIIFSNSSYTDPAKAWTLSFITACEESDPEPPPLPSLGAAAEAAYKKMQNVRISTNIVFLDHDIKHDIIIYKFVFT